MKAFDSCGLSDFELLRHSRRVNGDALWVRSAMDATLGRPRVAFAVNSHYGTAVQRNRLRRRLRAALTELKTVLPLGRFLVGTRGAIASTGTISYRMVCSDLETILTKTTQAKPASARA